MKKPGSQEAVRCGELRLVRQRVPGRVLETAPKGSDGGRASRAVVLVFVCVPTGVGSLRSRLACRAAREGRGCQVGLL
jgi:hypothetical protein